MSIAVTVVVPVHNTGATVLKGLDSFREQTLARTDFEVIYVDDGSTDDTAQLLETYLSGDPNFRLIRIANSGWPGRPRNVGIEAARGKYIHFVDDDDWLAPQALELLYERAEETGADIVAGRVAGHGRTAPRVLFDSPMSHGHIRKDGVLLSSMTVHKLFRKSLITKHGIRFPEGRVRLEDHMFMLRAYFLAGKVATVHDYTCYHWVRHTSGNHNISYGEINPKDYLHSVRTVINILSEYIEPGPAQNKFIAHWFSGKVLGQLLGKGFLKHPDDYRDLLFNEIHALTVQCIPEEVDQQLPTVKRVAAALVRHGERAYLEDFAEAEAGTTHEPRLEGLEWHGDELRVRISTTLVTDVAAGGTTPVLFEETEKGHRWHLPAHLATVPGASAAADVTAELPKSRIRGLLRRRDEGSEVLTPTVQRLVWVPHATQADKKLVGLRCESYFTVQAETGNHGKPLTGIWDAFVRMDSCGWTTVRRLGSLRTDSVEGERMPAFTGKRCAFVNPYWTTPYNNLSISINGEFGPLNRAVRKPEQIWIANDGSLLTVEIPVVMAPVHDAVDLAIVLESDGSEPIRIPAAVRPAPGPGNPVLAFQVPAAPLASACGGRPWKMLVERNGRSGKLGLKMHHDQATRLWRVHR